MSSVCGRMYDCSGFCIFSLFTEVCVNVIYIVRPEKNYYIKKCRRGISCQLKNIKFDWFKMMYFDWVKCRDMVLSGEQ